MFLFFKKKSEIEGVGGVWSGRRREDLLEIVCEKFVLGFSKEEMNCCFIALQKSAWGTWWADIVFHW